MKISNINLEVRKLLKKKNFMLNIIEVKINLLKKTIMELLKILMGKLEI